MVLGVFVGVQASNWNQARVERAETRRLLMRIEPEIDQIISFAANTRDYYATTRHFAETVFAAWHGDPKVSDNDFVIAAYQASQIHGLGESQSWAAVFGADQLRNVDDDRLRVPLARLMAFDVENLNSTAVASRRSSPRAGAVGEGTAASPRGRFCLSTTSTAASVHTSGPVPGSRTAFGSR